MASRTDLGSSWASGAAKNRVQDVSKSMFEAIEMAKRTLVEICVSPQRGASFSHAKRCLKRPRGTKGARNGHKMTPRGPKMAPRGPKMAPGGPIEAPAPIDPRLGRGQES